MKKLLIALGLLSGLGSAFADDLVIATGGEGGGYERLGKIVAQEIKQQSDKKGVNFDFEVINTNGSVENIELLNDGDAQIIVVQADALNVNKPSLPIRSKSAYTETVFWIFNEKNDKEDLSDIEGSDEYLVVLVEGSGATVTMQSFVQEDKGYTKNLEMAIYADDNYDAADIVSEGRYNGKKVAGMLYVGKTIPNEIARDFKGLVIGELTDSDFNDAKDVNGEDLYKSCDITSNSIKGMTTSTLFKPSSICVDAMVVYADTFEDSKEERVVKKGINKALRGYK